MRFNGTSIAVAALVALLLLASFMRAPKVQSSRQYFHASTSWSEGATALATDASEMLPSAADVVSSATALATDASWVLSGAVSSATSAAFGTVDTLTDETQAALAGFKAFVAQSAPGVAQTDGSGVGATAPPPLQWNGAAVVTAAPATKGLPAQAQAQAPSQSAAPTPAAGGALTLHPPPSPSAKQGACNRDHSKPLAQADTLCRVAVGGVAHVAMANGAYSELGVNWALLLLPLLAREGLEDTAFLYALDEPAVSAFVGRGFPTVPISTKAKHNPRVPSMDGFRWEPGAFRDYGVTKAEVILYYLRTGRHVCISDVDAAWIAPGKILPMLASVPDADVLSGTDCLHVPWDRDRSERKNKVRNCGHQPGSQWSAWFNTGVMVFRATPRAIDVAAEWRERMAAVKGDAQIDDQLTFNQMVGTVWSQPFRGGPDRFRALYPLKAASADGRVVFDGNGTRRIHAIPASVVCSAHVYHVQQSTDPRDCIVLHLTFVEGWPKNPAKYWRLREAGLLAKDPERTDGSYLSFTPPQPASIPPDRAPGLPPGRPNGDLPGKSKDNKGWPVATAVKHSPRLAAHLDLIDRNIAALRNAMGIARALGRQLVMPKMLCLCERAESPTSLLPSCVLDGSSTPIPHVCPLESVFDVARVEALWKSNYLTLRPWNLLNGSVHKPFPAGTAPIDHGKDVVTVRWSDVGAAATDAEPHVRYSAATREAWLLRGGSDAQFKQGLESLGLDGSRVLHLESAEMAFGGFEDASVGREFHRNIMSHLLGGWSATWCCTSWNKPIGTISFKRPLELPTGAAARAGSARPQEVPVKRPCYWRDCDEHGHQK